MARSDVVDVSVSVFSEAIGFLAGPFHYICCFFVRYRVGPFDPEPFLSSGSALYIADQTFFQGGKLYRTVRRVGDYSLSYSSALPGFPGASCILLATFAVNGCD